MSGQHQPGKYLSFRAGCEEFALPVASVREIIASQPVTPLPRTPDYVLGVINLRGRVLPVIDLRRRLEITGSPCAPGRTAIVVIQAAAGWLVGAMVDEVSEVAPVQGHEIESVQSFGHGLVESRYVSAVARSRGTVRLLLDVEAVLDRQDLGAAAPAGGSQ
jgi:purine-binding chemotaxis protein CheW